MAQQDSLPPTKQADSLQLQDKDSLLTKSKDSIPKDSTRRKLKDKGMDRLGVKKEDSISIRDYKIISYQRDTIYVDTTLTIKKSISTIILEKMILS